MTAVRPAAESLGATQFEVVTAAALLAFAAAEVDVAVVEAGLGGRHDATNVLDTRVVVLTNVALDHMDVLGDTREAIAAEKLAVVQPGAPSCSPRRSGASSRRRTARPPSSSPGAATSPAIAAAESFLGRPVDPHAADSVELPGRLERRGEHPLEIWDGAHNLAGIGWLLQRLPSVPGGWTVVCSILRDKRPGMMLEALSRARPDARRDGEHERPRAARRGARRARLRPLRAGGSRARADHRPRPRARARRPRRGGARHGLPVPSRRPKCRAPRPITPQKARPRSSRCSRLPLPSSPGQSVPPSPRAGLSAGCSCDARQLPQLRHPARDSQRPRVLRVRALALARLLDVQGREAADRGSAPDRALHAGRADPAVPRPVHLHALPPAGVPRGRARARARDQGDGGADRGSRPPLPGLPRRGRRGLSRLPRLHDEAQAGVR